MTWAVIGAAAVTTAGSAAAGSGKQLGAPAPAFGQGGGSPGLLGGPSLGLDPQLLELLSKQTQPQGGVTEALAQQPQPQTVQAPGSNPLGISDTVNALPGVNQDVLGSLGQEEGGGLGGFFGNLDQTLQSPSKLLGLGLLNQIDPRLAGGGLLAGGLFGGR